MTVTVYCFMTTHHTPGYQHTDQACNIANSAKKHKRTICEEKRNRKRESDRASDKTRVNIGSTGQSSEMRQDAIWMLNQPSLGDVKL